VARSGKATTAKRANGQWKKTFLIAFIDDASRVVVHAEFFYRDDTQNMVHAFRSALYKRGKSDRLYFDNGANYCAREVTQACLRLDILLTHAPVRDGAAKGKIERFFRGFRDRFLTLHQQFASLEELNRLTHAWVEGEYNAKFHSGIQMAPLDRFNLDRQRIAFLTDDAFTAEVFYRPGTCDLRVGVSQAQPHQGLSVLEHLDLSFGHGLSGQNAGSLADP
jgi:putative transposase